MKRMMKDKWIKYAVVVFIFAMMAGFFWPGMEWKVNATETNGETTKSITVNYYLGEDTSVWLSRTVSLADGYYKFNIPDDEPTKENDNSTFLGWASNLEGDTNLWRARAEVSLSENDVSGLNEIKFTAQWEEEPGNEDGTIPMESWNITIKYVSDGAVVKEEKQEGISDSGAIVVISPNVKPTKSNWTLVGWLYEDIIYELNTDTEQSISIMYENDNNKEITLVAQWRANPVTVIYKVEDNTTTSEIKHLTITEEEFFISMPEAEPSKEGFYFNGWIYEGEKVTSDTAFAWGDYAGRSIELTASFIENKQITIFYTGEGVPEGKEVITPDNIIDGKFQITPPMDLIIESGYLDVWKCEAASDSFSKEGDIYTFLWDKFNDGDSIEFIAQLWNGEVSESGKTYNLREGIPYTLGDGNWKVGDDGYSYSGGRDVFVRSSGSYTFTKN